MVSNNDFSGAIIEFKIALALDADNDLANRKITDATKSMEIAKDEEVVLSH